MTILFIILTIMCVCGIINAAKSYKYASDDYTAERAQATAISLLAIALICAGLAIML